MGETKRTRRKRGSCAVEKVKDRWCRRVTLRMGNRHVASRGPGTGSREGCEDFGNPEK